MADKISALRKSIDLAYIEIAEASRGSFVSDDDGLHQFAVASTMEATISALMSVKGLRQPSESVSPISAQRVQNLIETISGEISDIVEAEVGSALERLRGKSLATDPNGNLVVRTSAEQRSRGIYFTPSRLAETMLRPALQKALEPIDSTEKLRNFAILDPAAGCGAFLLCAVKIATELLAEKTEFSGFSIEQLRLEFVSHCIYGVDLDPVAIATVRSLLVAEVGVRGWSGEALDNHLHVGDSISTSISEWWRWFPEKKEARFDLIATNPPWSKLRPLRREFFDHIDSNVRLFQGTALGQYLEEHMGELIHADWEQYVNRTLELSGNLRKSDEYIVNRKSFGDPDLYKFFLERSIALLSPNGMAALLLPSAILRAQGAAPLREFLRNNGEISVLNEYINRKKIFDIHPMYRFCTILFKKGKRFEGMFARFSRKEVEESSQEDFVYLSSDFLDSVGGEFLLIPEVRSELERKLLGKIYSENPVSGRTWPKHLSFKRELDMTNDSPHFIDAHEAGLRGFTKDSSGRWSSSRCEESLLPVYEGRMVHQYDHVAKQYVGGHGRGAKWEAPTPGQGIVSPHFFVTESYARSRGWEPIERVGYCEIGGHANERTVLAALIPPYSICGNKVPILKVSEPDEYLLWLAFANSLVIDWVIRRWVSTTVNQFYWKNIPFPKDIPREDADFLKSAARRLSDLKESQDDSTLWLGHRAQLRAAIDAVVMNLFHLSNEEREIVLEDFPAFGKAWSRGPRGSIPLCDLLKVYSDVHLDGRLRIDNVHTFCSPKDCSATYATKDQVKNI